MGEIKEVNWTGEERVRDVAWQTSALSAVACHTIRVTTRV
jgi:hypothetical protein